MGVKREARLAPDTHGSWFEREQEPVKLPLGRLLVVPSGALVFAGETPIKEKALPHARYCAGHVAERTMRMASRRPA
jgi:hypothetical protein